MRRKSEVISQVIGKAKIEGKLAKILESEIERAKKSVQRQLVYLRLLRCQQNGS